MLTSSKALLSLLQLFKKTKVAWNFGAHDEVSENLLCEDRLLMTVSVKQENVSLLLHADPL